MTWPSARLRFLVCVLTSVSSVPPSLWGKHFWQRQLFCSPTFPSSHKVRSQWLQQFHCCPSWEVPNPWQQKYYFILLMLSGVAWVKCKSLNKYFKIKDMSSILFHNELLNCQNFHLSSVLFSPSAIWSHCALHNHMHGLRLRNHRRQTHSVTCSSNGLRRLGWRLHCRCCRAAIKQEGQRHNCKSCQTKFRLSCHVKIRRRRRNHCSWIKCKHRRCRKCRQAGLIILFRLYKKETGLSREVTMETMTGIVPTKDKTLSTRDTSVAQQLPWRFSQAF